MPSKDLEILNEIIVNLTFYVPILTISIGTIGSVCNVLIFTSKELRFNSCAFYFLCSTIFDLFYLLLGGITRFLSDHYPSTLPNESILFCKCRTYLVVAIPSLSTHFLMLASIDRCLSTSTLKKWRNLTRIKIARYISPVTLILTLFFTCHILFLYEIRVKDVNVYLCVPHSGVYTTFITICFLLSSPFIVYTIMFSCTFLTLLRIRTLRYRMGCLNNRRRRIDRHLITIMFVQIGLGMFLTLFRCGFLVYSLSTYSIKKTNSRISIETFLDKFSLLIYYINFAKAFPVNTLTSTLFRHVFRKRIMNLFTSICPFIKKERTIINRLTINRQNQVKEPLQHL